METICDWFDFVEAENSNVPWHRIEGGMSVLTDALHDYAVKQGVNVVTNCPVTAQLQPLPPTQYSAVFNTTMFGCLQRMDLSGLPLSADNLCRIRTLSYDPAIKVCIKCTSPWGRGLVPSGGVSNTDLCISNVVYPSWDDGPDSAHTIKVSYSWAQDATRMESLMPINDVESTDPTDPVVQLCIRDLVKL